MKSNKYIFFKWLAVMSLMLAGSPAFAHNVSLANATAVVQADGDYAISLTFDLAAYLAQVEPARLSDVELRRLLEMDADSLSRTIETSRQRFASQIMFVYNDQVRAAGACDFPSPDATRSYLAECLHPGGQVVAPPVTVRVSAVGGTNSVKVIFPHETGAVSLSVKRENGETSNELLLPGELSEALALAPGTANDRPRAEVAWRYLTLGFEHILPRGLDHILFVLGLFLLSPKLKPLLWQITAFTVAHSISLALSIYHVVSLPASIVEPLIALSIAFVALENVFTNRLNAWRPLVVFCFGLVHGLGFARVLFELGLPRHDYLTALISFNAGVELGQITVVMAAFLAVGWSFQRVWYRARVIVPASITIAVIGVYWTIERLMT